MAIYKQTQLDRTFSEVLARKLQDGYNMTTGQRISGSVGGFNDCKGFIMEDPNTGERFVLGWAHTWGWENDHRSAIVWFKDKYKQERVEVLYTWYPFKQDTYTDDLNEWHLIREKEKARAKAKYNPATWAYGERFTFTNERAKTAVLAFVRSHKGYKRSKLEDITAVCKDLEDTGNGYRIVSWTVHTKKGDTFYL